MVYISEFDFLQGNKTTYHIDSVIREDGRTIDNGLRMICVNTKIDDGTEIADLMKCFLQSEVSDIRFPNISNRMKYLKQSQGGERAMCKIMEEYAQEVVKDTIKDQIQTALKKNKNPEDIADFIKVPLEQVLKMKAEMEI